MFMSTELASPRALHIAAAAVAVSAIAFVCAIPFARIQLGPMAAFVPMYVSALVICDIITVVLLVGQFRFLRSPAILVLACGYAFTATMTFSYVLMFPGLFSEAGLLGAGSQSTSAMYIFWHAGFPLLVIGYALARKPAGRGAAGQHDRKVGPTIVIAMASVVGLVIAYTILVTTGSARLPVFIAENRTTQLGHLVLTGDWLLSFAALVVLWHRRPYTLIDLWLMMVMCVWLCDLALAAILNTGRYDLGWYFGRVYGLLAAGSLLVMLLVENGNHYARVVRLSAKLSDANDALEELSQRDGLTGIANRRSFDAYLASQVAIASRHGRPLSLVLCDVDFFKAYNDRYGHQAGDECLKQIATMLQSCCRRPADLAARYGGEEFALILPDTDLAGAALIADAARLAVLGLKIRHLDSTAGGYVSLSGGVATLQTPGGRGAEGLIASADRALFDAKRRGRNQMVVTPARPNLVVPADGGTAVMLPTEAVTATGT